MERSTLSVKTEGSPEDGCSCGESEFTEEVAERSVSDSMGIDRGSSSDCCDDGTTNSSKGAVETVVEGEGAMETGAVEGGIVEVSGRSKVVTCS